MKFSGMKFRYHNSVMAGSRFITIGFSNDINTRCAVFNLMFRRKGWFILPHRFFVVKRFI